LAKDYFGEMYPKVIENLIRGENVCISVISGFGVKTLFNFLDFNISNDNLFDHVFVYDPEIEKGNLLEFTKGVISEFPDDNKLIIVRFFEQTKHKSEILEKLDSLRRRSPKSLVFLVFADHSAIIDTNEYQARSTIFFTEIFYMKPFDKNQSEKMIKSLTNFYGWRTDENLYEKIYSISGGIPRIIKYVVKEIYETRTPINNFEKFLSSPHISFQLELLTKLLIKLPKKKVEMLGLVVKGKIKSKLLQHYFLNYQNNLAKQLFINLTKQESKILSFLLENQGVILQVDKIADLIEMADEKYSLWAIYKLISRLKGKVKKYFEIQNFKGQGYMLQNTKP